jgi:hypothetical protein
VTGKINCPVYGKAVEYSLVSDVPTFPFCSERCRWADLDKWLKGQYRISEKVTDRAEGERAGGVEPAPGAKSLDGD